ncbi:unnamed protein product, partial [marine sediment metagenome]
MSTSDNSNLALWLVNKKNWLTHFMIVAGICIAGLIYLGGATYSGAPPLVDFVSTEGKTVVSLKQINHGKELFHLRGLMSYGSFWGDGAERGPDFTADALHRTVLGMRAHYLAELDSRGAGEFSEYDADAVAARVVREVHNNTYDEDAGV